MDAILATPSTKTWIGKRDYALLLTLYNTGARISEILTLRQHQVAFGATSLLHLKGKGRKERSVPSSALSKTYPPVLSKSDPGILS
jgi:site-specific recombinase XerD